MTNQEFCEIYSSFYGEKISSIKQLTIYSADGAELKEFVEHAIKTMINIQPSDKCTCWGSYGRAKSECSVCSGKTDNGI